MDEIPSPAVRRRPAESERGNAGFDHALFGALRAQLARVERENAELHLTVSQLNARLYRANQARERWLERQRAWHRERSELLGRLDGRRDDQ